MKTIALPSMLGVLLAVALSAPPALAVNDVSYVSASGSDANLCTRSQPCLTIDHAYTQTFDRGEIKCLDTAAVTAPFVSGGFGIGDKSITVDCNGGTISSFGLGSIVTFPSGSDNVVTLRNITFNGFSSANIGLGVQGGGTLIIENCKIIGFRSGSVGHGLRIVPNSGTLKLFVSDSLISNNGLASSGGGIFIQPTGAGSARVVLNRVTAENNTHGIVADGTGTTGSIVVQVRDSSVAGHLGNGIWVKRAGVVVDLTSVLNNAGYAIFADGPGALVVLGNSSVIGKGSGLVALGGGSIQSYQNNQTKGNGFDGAPTAVLSLN